ncbi:MULTISPECIES: SCO6745 family protein [unclassified Streptomyces]|uniref:SCO6745 family protein n=1 Tax=unclassified Streptomyces TaxID=2593676 RepID=UPI003405F444
MADGRARALWERYEPVHDLVYFAPEAHRAADALGLRGFWMGYFALRAAPLGAVSPSVVTSCFHVFHPSRVARALPDAWAYAAPADVLAARLEAMDAALTRVAGADAVGSAAFARAADLAWEAAAAADTTGRVLAAANQALGRPERPAARLWQAVTTLREHRGDSHVAVLVGLGLGPVEAMVLKAAAGESDGAFLRETRKWPARDWAAAEERLRADGRLAADGSLTPAGAALRARTEALTDAAAERPWTALGAERTERLAALLEPLAHAVRESGLLPAANPVGLTRRTLPVGR